MFCYQCEQTAKGTGCTVHGVCGKDPETSNLQDLLVYETMLLARAALGGGKGGEAVHTVIDNLFTTVTNVNFDPRAIAGDIKETRELRDFLSGGCDCACDCDCGCGGESIEEMAEYAEQFTPQRDIEKYGAALGGLKWLAIYGLKGTAAYAHHARLAMLKNGLDMLIVSLLSGQLLSFLQEIKVQEILATSQLLFRFPALK